jgi:hypothetical protein
MAGERSLHKLAEWEEAKHAKMKDRRQQVAQKELAKVKGKPKLAKGSRSIVQSRDGTQVPVVERLNKWHEEASKRKRSARVAKQSQESRRLTSPYRERNRAGREATTVFTDSAVERLSSPGRMGRSEEEIARIRSPERSARGGSSKPWLATARSPVSAASPRPLPSQPAARSPRPSLRSELRQTSGVPLPPPPPPPLMVLPRRALLCPGLNLCVV